MAADSGPPNDERWWINLGADRDGFGTAGPESTTARRIEWRWDVTGEDDAVGSLTGRIGNRRCGEESSRIGMVG